MKKLVMISAAMMLFASAAFAQDKTDAPKAKLTPEEVAQRQAVRMAEKLMLSDAENEKFIPLYQAYKVDLNAINKKYRVERAKVEPGQTPAPKSDKEVDQQIRAQFAKSQEILDQRVAYYEKFLKILTPKQIQQMYKAEKEQANDAIARKHGQQCGSKECDGPKGNLSPEGRPRPAQGSAGQMRR